MEWIPQNTGVHTLSLSVGCSLYSNKIYECLISFKKIKEIHTVRNLHSLLRTLNGMNRKLLASANILLALFTIGVQVFPNLIDFFKLKEDFIFQFIRLPVMPLANRWWISFQLASGAVVSSLPLQFSS